MKNIQTYTRFVALALAALAVAACANKMEPAQKAIADIEAAVAAAGEDASRVHPRPGAGRQRPGRQSEGDVRQEGLQGRARRRAGGPDRRRRASRALPPPRRPRRWTCSRASGAPSPTACRRRWRPFRAGSTSSRSRRSCRRAWTPRRFDSVKTGLADANSMWTQATQAQAAGRPGAGRQPGPAGQDAHGRTAHDAGDERRLTCRVRGSQNGPPQGGPFRFRPPLLRVRRGAKMPPPVQTRGYRLGRFPRPVEPARDQPDAESARPVRRARPAHRGRADGVRLRRALRR